MQSDTLASASGAGGGGSDSSGGRGLGLHRPTSARNSKDCPFIFIEPQPWMNRNVLERDGQLECYKCKRKLGKFDWTSSESCHCDLHNIHGSNLNLFKIMRKKVDFGQLPVS